MDISFVLILVFFGVVGGFLSGLLGVGGGIIFIPIISYFLQPLGLNSEEFVRYLLANSFATIFFAGLISTYKQYRIKQFYPKQIAATALFAMGTSSGMTYLIASENWYNKTTFSIIFLGLLVFTVLRFVVKLRHKPKEVKDTPYIKYMITGLLTGVVTSLSGLGGGIVMIPLFNQYVKIDMRSASAISIGAIPLILLPVLITYMVLTPPYHVAAGQIGYVMPHLFFPMVAGLLFAAPIGVATAQKASDKLLKIIFASLVIIVIVNTVLNLVK